MMIVVVFLFVHLFADNIMVLSVIQLELVAMVVQDFVAVPILDSYENDFVHFYFHYYTF